ncbi:MAG: ABC transporter ATP-binding protein [Ilumatobacteraceae bacterium]
MSEPSGETVVRVRDVSKRFRIHHERHQSLKQSLLNRRRSVSEDFWALRDISFDVFEGETFGIIGHNGSGKSTMLKCLTGILQPDSGSIAVDGTISALLELGAGFHPELSGRENVFLNAAILGLSRRQVEERYDEIVAFSGLEQFIDTPVKNYSSGMFVRLGFAVAVNVDPDVLIIDEVLAVGDAEFQAKCGDKIAEYRERNKTIVLVTHSMDDVVRLCSRAAWIDHGRLRMIGAPGEITDSYLDTAHSGRTVQVTDALRRGDGRARITDVVFLGGDGAPVQIPRSGEPLAIRFTVTATQPVIGPELSLTVFDQGGTLVTEVDTRRRGVDIPLIAGSIDLTLELDHLALSEGTYEMSAALRDPADNGEIDVRTRFVRFDVLKGAVSDGGLVTLGGSWKVG